MIPLNTQSERGSPVVSCGLFSGLPRVTHCLAPLPSSSAASCHQYLCRLLITRVFNRLKDGPPISATISGWRVAFGEYFKDHSGKRRRLVQYLVDARLASRHIYEARLPLWEELIVSYGTAG
jgi:hypothetical protein